MPSTSANPFTGKEWEGQYVLKPGWSALIARMSRAGLYSWGLKMSKPLNLSRMKARKRRRNVEHVECIHRWYYDDLSGKPQRTCEVCGKVQKARIPWVSKEEPRPQTPNHEFWQRNFG